MKVEITNRVTNKVSSLELVVLDKEDTLYKADLEKVVEFIAYLDRKKCKLNCLPFWSACLNLKTPLPPRKWLNSLLYKVKVIE